MDVDSNNRVRLVDFRDVAATRAAVRSAVPRAAVGESSVAPAAADVVRAVRERGSSAVLEFSARFDGVQQSVLRVPESALDEALRAMSVDLREAVEAIVERARRFASAQQPAPVLVQYEGGAQVALNWHPVDRAGVYVPGGKAVYPSSVVMNVVPAQVAGVGSIVLASPPQSENDGLPHPTVLATAAMLGIREVYAIGGAQAVASLAYGLTDDDPGLGLEPVDLITGPGNDYVAAAKRLVRGDVAVDMEAGATEVMILADALADPALIVADMVCQAEHDERAAAVLVTDSAELEELVQVELQRQVALTPHSARVRAALGGRQSAVVLVDDMLHGVAFCNAYAAEHLEIHAVEADELAGQIRHAGAIFIGATTPVTLGDYSAGSNHVLPTGGTATSASGLSVYSYLRGVQSVRYPQSSLGAVRDVVRVLSAAEDLPAHGAALEARFGSL
ncbi:histidinol dehydrogenase [Cellulomonas sp. ACRRI]|uniref:histidinol dehydrogenase n=1 Tax=Cellulomonas sp. ACRRI TaxID=2918188 RepID=UPI001EF3B458|nr:histidinol dehydrogenase [Cellulomonas sp. ACRRI]MCG7284765.1 histidinol dehydrogenase [Cellulomonas sp. ACRRI]